MNERTFQAVIRYGAIALAVGIVLNVWIVMRYVEIYRDASRLGAQVQQLLAQQQAIQSVLQEFASRASSDSEIASIFKRAQTMASTASPSTSLSNQPLTPTATTGSTQ